MADLNAAEAARLLPKTAREERARLEADWTRLAAFVERVAGAQSSAVLMDPALATRARLHGAWAEHFRCADAALRGVDAWDGAMKELIQSAAKHDKSVGKTLDALAQPDRKAFDAGVAALTNAYLARRAGEVEALIARAAQAPPKGVDEEDLARVRKLLEERRAAREQGQAACDRIMAEQVHSLREQHPDLFAAGEEAGESAH